MSLEAIWETIKKNIIKYLVGTLAGLSGVKGWIVEKMVSRLLDSYIKPIVLWLERKGILWKKKIVMKKEVKDLENAKTKSEIDTSIDNIP